MNLRYTGLLVSLLLASASSGCSAGQPEISTGRWYTSAQVEQGRAVFQTHCASCHGVDAEGTAEWRMTDANGNYPPPPLNGSAHTWHHPMSVLEQTIADGGVPLGGVMPGFADTLSSDEARSTIAYFQSQWSDDVYARWHDIDAR